MQPFFVLFFMSYFLCPFLCLFQFEDEVSGSFQVHRDVLSYFTSTKRSGLFNC